ncbi:MAG TPA: hypothetical protein VFU51_03990 [Gaiellaceae bacterium]|nr:hypothetical protein [Gaiellaceae bacterium]
MPVGAVDLLDARAHSFPHRHLPWVDTFAAHRRNMQTLDVALCPIRRGWSTLRTDSKPLEHLTAGSLPLISDVETDDSWKPLLPAACATQADWLDRVRWAVRHRDEVRETAERLRQIVLEEGRRPRSRSRDR